MSNSGLRLQGHVQTRLVLVLEKGGDGVILVLYVEGLAGENCGDSNSVQKGEPL